MEMSDTDDATRALAGSSRTGFLSGSRVLALVIVALMTVLVLLCVRFARLATLANNGSTLGSRSVGAATIQDHRHPATYMDRNVSLADDRSLTGVDDVLALLPGASELIARPPLT